MAYTEDQIKDIQERIFQALEDMTLTTMGCPLADLITDQIHDVLKDVPEVTEVDVRLVWSPAWTVQKMSRYARIALGIK